MTYHVLWTNIEWLDVPVNGFILKNSVLFGTRSFKNLWHVVCFPKLIILEFNLALETEARKCLHLNIVLNVKDNVLALTTSILCLIHLLCMYFETDQYLKEDVESIFSILLNRGYFGGFFISTKHSYLHSFSTMSYESYVRVQRLLLYIVQGNTTKKFFYVYFYIYFLCVFIHFPTKLKVIFF